jgi:magnesium-transporting ATPase (P-type)
MVYIATISTIMSIISSIVSHITVFTTTIMTISAMSELMTSVASHITVFTTIMTISAMSELMTSVVSHIAVSFSTVSIMFASPSLLMITKPISPTVVIEPSFLRKTHMMEMINSTFKIKETPTKIEQGNPSYKERSIIKYVSRNCWPNCSNFQLHIRDFWRCNSDPNNRRRGR